MASNKDFWKTVTDYIFGRGQNLDGDVKSVVPAVTPTINMLVSWAKRDTDISEMWVFGSAEDPDNWDHMTDDLDVLAIVPDDKWKHDLASKIVHEAPMSEQYMPIDLRVKRESDCEPWLTLAKTGQLAETSDDKENLVENVFRHGVLIWRRSDDPDVEDDANES